MGRLPEVVEAEKGRGVKMSDIRRTRSTDVGSYCSVRVELLPAGNKRSAAEREEFDLCGRKYNNSFMKEI